jgi:hypothetical protein
LVAKIASLRPQYWKYFDKTSAYLALQNKQFLSNSEKFINYFNNEINVLEFMGKKKHFT